MGGVLYNLGISVYGIAVKLAAPFIPKANAWVSGRKNWKIKLSSSLKQLNRKRPVIWFHASSLGEFEQGRPVMEALKNDCDVNLVLTFFSPSGYEVMKNWPTVDSISYLPLDSKNNASDFVRLVKPDLAVFVKYEFWYYYLKQLTKQQIPTYVISARFYSGQLFFKNWAKWYRNVLFLVDRIYVQDKASENLLKGIGYDSIVLSGDTRFDRVAELSKNSDRFFKIEDFSKGEKLFIAGSSWPLDETLICKYINEYPANYNYLIAPHDISSKHINKIEKQLTVPVQRFSAYKKENPAKVLILDTIGMLSRIYKYARVAYIGGGFKEGLHNILEPAAYGVPVITGPDHNGFPEGGALEKAGGLIRIKDFKELEAILNIWEADKQKAGNAGKAAKQFIVSHTGATVLIKNDLIEGLSALK